MTRWARVAVVVVVALAWLAGAAPPAGAHATLQETNPAADSVLDEPPAGVELRFSESVDPGLGGVEVSGPDGDRVDRGRAERADDDRVVAVPVDAATAGTYTVAWSVVSEDGHLISGSFVFSVGKVTGVADSGSSGRPGVRVVAGVARWTAFAGTIAVVGALAFGLAIGGGAVPPDRRQRLVPLLRVGALATLVGALGVLVTQVALASGRGVANSVGLLGDAVSNTRFGALSFARAGVAAAAVVLTVPAGLVWRRAGQAGLGIAALGLLVLPGLSGHAWTVEPRWASVALDATHLAGASVWIGGLAALLVVAPGSGAAGALTRRFSAAALVAVAVVAGTGSVSAYLQVRSAEALTGSGYGRLLLAKVAVVAALVVLGWVNRRRLASLLPEPRSVFGVVRAELALAVVVIAFTAALVNRPPARDDVTGSVDTVVEAADGPAGAQVQVEVDPARRGPNDVHLYFLGADGLPRTVDAIEMTVERDGVPPRRVPVTPVTPDHASAYGVAMPSAGTWTLTITSVREGESSTSTLEVPIP